VLLKLLETKISYVVQEAIVVIKDIFRRYPNEYESIIGALCENLDALDEPEAKAAMIWIIGQYADRIENSDELLEDFLFTFNEEPTEVSFDIRSFARLHFLTDCHLSPIIRCNWHC
jgi:AP-2 complex subunit beta-1